MVFASLQIALLYVSASCYLVYAIAYLAVAVCYLRFAERDPSERRHPHLHNIIACLVYDPYLQVS